MTPPPSKAIEAVEAANAALQAAGLPTYSEALKALSLLADDLQCALPALRKIGWQTHNEEGTLRRADAILDKANPGTARPPKAPHCAACDGSAG